MIFLTTWPNKGHRRRVPELFLIEAFSSWVYNWSQV